MKIKEFSSSNRDDHPMFRDVIRHKLVVLVDGETFYAQTEMHNKRYVPREEILEMLIRGISDEISSRLRGMLA